MPEEWKPLEGKHVVVVQSRFRSKEPDSMEDRVVRAIMKAWSSLREGLILMHVKMLDERLR